MYRDWFRQRIGPVELTQTVLQPVQQSSTGESDPELATAIAFLSGNAVFELPEAAPGHSEQRLSLLHALVVESHLARRREAASTIVADILSRHTADVPFALVYLFDVDG